MIASPEQAKRESVSDSTQALAIRANQGRINVYAIASSAQVLTVFLTRTFFNYSKMISSKNHQTHLKRMLDASLTN